MGGGVRNEKCSHGTDGVGDAVHRKHDVVGGVGDPALAVATSSTTVGGGGEIALPEIDMGFSAKDVELAAQVQNFSTVLAANAALYGQTPATAAAVTAAVDAFVASLNALTEARANGVRSEQMTAEKDANRSAMLDLLKPIYLAVQASKAISDQAKIALGVRIAATRRTRQPVPDFAPLISVVKVNGHVVTVRMADPNEPNSKARPASVSGMALFSYVGEEAPKDPSAFKFEFNIGQTEADVTFPASVPIGATVYFAAFFFNNRKQKGPMSTPVSAQLGAGSIMPTAMKIAA
jgi:hypothetical protein